MRTTISIAGGNDSFFRSYASPAGRNFENHSRFKKEFRRKFRVHPEDVIHVKIDEAGTDGYWDSGILRSFLPNAKISYIDRNDERASKEN